MQTERSSDDGPAKKRRGSAAAGTDADDRSSHGEPIAVPCGVRDDTAATTNDNGSRLGQHHTTMTVHTRWVSCEAELLHIFESQLLAADPDLITGTECVIYDACGNNRPF